METRELDKTYSPQNIEQKWYQKWSQEGHFKPKKGKANKTFCIIMPPPNVTGKLHMGHALDTTTQDALTRFKRMKGYETLWLPGMDHAGIATQSVVEKKIFAEEGKKKDDLGREKFLEKVWKWKEEYGGTIAHQQRSLGASCDWDYSLFTMDSEANEAVRECFTTLYNEGLIYQSDYIINWDPVLKSAISDAEVDHKEVKGAFYHILYQVKDSDLKLEIATTRPETLLGDTAVAVNPKDDRFKHLIGKTVIVPICNREVPVIGDEYVDIELGTGCLKVTPGHDFNDFEIGKRHNLPILNILNDDGTLNDLTGPDYKNLNCKVARKKIVDVLQEQGILVLVKDYVHQVGHGERSGAIIEPRVSKQWFLNVQKMAEEAVNLIKNEDTKFFPKGWENTYFSWLNSPKDWCISRQLWWGHRIPIFYCENDSCLHTFGTTELEPTECPKCHGKKLRQDPDVLDTWFSSGIWPISTLGWPNKERMKEKRFYDFYPTTTLVTAYDIIFFWVARMMMMCTKLVGKKPFSDIYIHAIVRDKLGRKMSKSLGNGIDPLEVVEQFGTDALRFTLSAGSGYNRNLNLDPEKIEGYRNFINKIWNAFRFIHPFLSEAKSNLPKFEKLHHHERWILSELSTVIKTMNESMEEYRYDDSCAAIYSYVYDKFCSWFIEVSKNVLYGDNEEEKIQRATVLKYAFREIVKLLHPFTPFVTEEIWDYLKNNDSEDLLISQEYPEFNESLHFEEDQKMMNEFIQTVTIIRNLRASVNIKPKELVSIELFLDDENLKNYYLSNKLNFQELAKVKELNIQSKASGKKPLKSIVSASSSTEVYIPLEGVIDLEEQINRIKKEIAKASAELSKLDAKMNNKNFMDNAPESVVIEVKEKHKNALDKVNSLNEGLKIFEA